LPRRRLAERDAAAAYLLTNSDYRHRMLPGPARHPRFKHLRFKIVKRQTCGDGIECIVPLGFSRIMLDRRATAAG
jgi:hypothetical protein